MPTLTIIIPVHNKQKYLCRCIDSVLCQAWTDYELVIIDDGSTDGSVELERQYAQQDGRIKLFEYENAGVSTARNRGMEKATGEYLMFIDADDYIRKGYLEFIMHKVAQEDADIFVWGLTKQFSDGCELQLSPSIKTKLSRKDFLEQFVSQQYSDIPGPYGYVPNKLIKRSLIMKQGLLFDPQLRLMEDYDFFLSCYAVCQTVSCFDEVGYYYFIDSVPASIQYTRNVNFVLLVRVHQKCMKLLERNGCLSDNNKYLIQHAIDECTLSAYIELGPVTFSALHTLEEELPPLSDSFHSNKWRILIYTLRKRNKYFIYCFLKLWRIYIYFRRLIDGQILQGCTIQTTCKE